MPRLLFHDDFSDGIWTKHPANPVMLRDQPWAESDFICEPNVLYIDGQFRMWFSQMYPPSGRTALGYATSPDGLTWTKHPHNPVLAPDDIEVHRPAVMRHAGVYYLFAVQHEQDAQRATMRRWSSVDGIAWDNGRQVMSCTAPWEGGLSNMAVVIDDEGIWRMIYTGADEPGGPQSGYAWSADGVTWAKHPANPVITGFYGGDPFMLRIGDRYYLWHSQTMAGSLRIACRSSADLVHWGQTGGHADINYSQPWERGVRPEDGGTTASYYGHLTDATLCQAGERVLMAYQGAQTPLGVATFEGTLEDLAARLQSPPLSRWEPSPFGMVEGGTLKIGDSDSDRAPLVARVDGAGEAYVLQARVRCYAGPTHRVSLVMRYADSGTYARVWLHEAGTVYYQECLRWLLSNPLPIGAAPIADNARHDWEIAVQSRGVAVTVDGRPIGSTQTGEALMRSLSDRPVHVGFSTHDTWASIERVSVRG